MFSIIKRWWKYSLGIIKGISKTIEKKEVQTPQIFPFIFPLVFEDIEPVHQLCCAAAFSWGRIVNTINGKEYIQLLPNQTEAFQQLSLSSDGIQPLASLVQDKLVLQPFFNPEGMRKGKAATMRLYGNRDGRGLTSSTKVRLRNNNFIVQFAFKFYSPTPWNPQQSYLMWINYGSLESNWFALRIDKTRRLYAFRGVDGKEQDIVRSDPLEYNRSYIITWYYDTNKNQHGLIVNFGPLFWVVVSYFDMPEEINIIYGNGPISGLPSLNAEYGGLFFQTEEIPSRHEFEKNTFILAQEYL